MNILGVVQLKIAPKLRPVFKGRRITLKEITKATGIPSPTVAEWKNNRAPNNPVQRKRLADFLEMTLEEPLFGLKKSSGDSPSVDAPLASVLKEDIFSGTFRFSIKRDLLAFKKLIEQPVGFHVFKYDRNFIYEVFI